MNYYNPYFNMYPYYGTMNLGTNIASRTGMFSRLFDGLNFSNILSGTQKTLNIANQAIPLIKQAKPMMQNAKTMFKVMNEFKKVDTPSVSSKNINSIKNNNLINDNENKDITGPTFFA